MSVELEARRPASPLGLLRQATSALWRVEHAFERARAADKAVDDTRVRILVVLAVFGLGFAAVGADAVRKALFSHPASSEFAEPPPAAARADLVDRNGRLLAVDLAHFGLYLDPREIWDTAETRRGLLHAIPRLDAKRLARALKGRRREYLIGALTPQEKERVHDLGLPGVSFEEEAKRVYPLGATAGHLIGYADSGGKGLAGAERGLDPAIQAAAKAGGQMELSLDLRVQAALEDEVRRGMAEFGALGAVGVVTDVQTGEVLALTSQPDFDPAAPGGSNPNALVNRAAASDYEMGSTFKIFTFATGLDSGVVDMRTTFDASQPLKIGARLVHDYHKGESILSMEDTFILSSNIGTARMGLMAGAARMQSYFSAFGLLSPTPVELAEAARPLVPRVWDEGTVASASFGNAISVTPLHMAAGVGSIVNGGTYVPLTLLKRSAAPVGRRVIKPETSRLMLDLLRDNVAMPHGSGGKADALGLRVGGKTGSNEKSGPHGIDRDKLVTSFAAVFPTDGALDAKRYLVLILFDEPHATPKTFGFKTAGWNAAPTAGRVIDRIAPFLGVARMATTPFAAPRAAEAKPVEEAPTGPM